MVLNREQDSVNTLQNSKERNSLDPISHPQNPSTLQVFVYGVDILTEYITSCFQMKTTQGPMNYTFMETFLSLKVRGLSWEFAHTKRPQEGVTGLLVKCQF